MNDGPWYEQLRQQYRPQQVKVLLIAESPPASTSEERRFFYSSHLTGHDNLFRGVALAAYGLNKHDLTRDGKATVLRRLQSDGIWLIDAVDTPVNHLDNAHRNRLIRESTAGLIRRTQMAAPSVGTFICKAPLHDLIARSLEAAGIVVLNQGPAPFPLGNTRAEFVNCWRRDVPSR